MQQVADWLRKVSLGQYAQRFPEKELVLGARIFDRSGPGKDRRPARASTKDVSGHWRACRFSPATSAIYADRGEAPSLRRAPPSDCDVLGPRRFYRALRAHRRP